MAVTPAHTEPESSCKYVGEMEGEKTVSLDQEKVWAKQNQVTMSI